MEEEEEKHTEEKARTEIVYINIKKEELEPYEEGIIKQQTKDTNCDILEPKLEIETFSCVKQEVLDEFDEKPTIEYGIVSKYEIPEGESYPYAGSPETLTVHQYLKTNLIVTSKEKRMKCPYCSKVFARKVAILKHVVQHKWTTKISTLNRDFEITVSVKDEKQGTISRNQHTSLKHIERSDHHQQLNTSDPTECPYACTHCEKRFDRRWKLNKHTPMHRSQRPYVCYQCDKSYKWKNTLQRHQLNTHGGEKPHACEYCGARFAHRLHAARHELTHTGEKPFACATCGTSFARRWTLTRHMRHHCGPARMALKGHGWNCATDKPFLCNVCGDVYEQEEHLRLHSATHWERKFACGFCGERFKTKRGMLRHTANMHI